jgi:hypothetical protein
MKDREIYDDAYTFFCECLEEHEDIDLFIKERYQESLNKLESEDEKVEFINEFCEDQTGSDIDDLLDTLFVARRLIGMMAFSELVERYITHEDYKV